MNIEKNKIETKLGSYIISREKGLPLRYEKIGKNLDYYKRNIAQKFIFRTKDQIKELSGTEFYVSLKRDGIFVGFYFNKKEKEYKSFFVNSPTHRIYMGLPINKDLETHLINAGVNEALLVGELIASPLDPPNFEKRCRVYDLTFYTRSPKKKEDMERIGFKIFDIIKIDNRKIISKPFNERDIELKKLFPKEKGRFGRVKRKKLKKADIKPYFETIVKEGMEGLVAQTNSIAYKIKSIHTIDVAIIGYSVGRINSRINPTQISSLLTALRYDDGTYQLLTKVGGGLTDDKRTELFNIIDKTKAISKEFYTVTTDGRAFQMVKPTLVGEIKYFDLLIESRGELLKQNCLIYDEDKNKWKIVKELPFPKLIFPRFSETAIRDDKSPQNIKDVRIQQITDLIDTVPPREIKKERLPKSKILFLLVFTKGGNMIRKFIGFKTNKEKFNFPEYVIYICDFSVSRKAPITRRISVATTFENFEKEFEKMLKLTSPRLGVINEKGEKIRGWEIYYGKNDERIKGYFEIKELDNFDPNIMKKLKKDKDIIEKVKQKEKVEIIEEEILEEKFDEAVEEGEYEIAMESAEEYEDAVKKEEELQKKFGKAIEEGKYDEVMEVIEEYKEEEKKLYDKYYQETGKKAIRGGKETQIYQKWKEKYLAKTEEKIDLFKIIIDLFDFIESKKFKKENGKILYFNSPKSFDLIKWWDNIPIEKRREFINNYGLLTKGFKHPYSDEFIEDFVKKKWKEIYDEETKARIIYRNTDNILSFFTMIHNNTKDLYIQLEDNEVIIDNKDLKKYWNSLEEDSRKIIIKEIALYKQVPKEFRESKWEALSLKRRERIKKGLIDFRKLIIIPIKS